MKIDAPLFLFWFLVAIALACLVYWTWRKNNEFSLLDFVTTQGKGDPPKAAYTGSFLISSWLMWQLTVSDKMTEGYLALYVGAFVAGEVWKRTSLAKTNMSRPSDRWGKEE